MKLIKCICKILVLLLLDVFAIILLPLADLGGFSDLCIAAILTPFVMIKKLIKKPKKETEMDEFYG